MKTRTWQSRISKLLALSALAFVLVNACQDAPATINISPPTVTSPSVTLSALPATANSAPETSLPTDSPQPPPTRTSTPLPNNNCLPTSIPSQIKVLKKPIPITSCEPKVCLRWFVGLGMGGYPSQIKVEEEVVMDFNISQHNIYLVFEAVPHLAAPDTLFTEIASGNGPDVVGPVKWTDVNDFNGQWLDLAPYIRSSSFNTSIFNPALVKAYRTKEGQVGLPLTVYPSGLFFVPALFDKAGLAYPPQAYGEKYKLPDGKLVPWNWDTVELIAKLLTLDQNGKNATEVGFDRNQIVQVGYVPQGQHPNSFGVYDGGASQIYTGNKKGTYEAAIPDLWKKAWQRHYEAMWGAQPWMPTGLLASSPEFSSGNLFSSGKVAMALTQTGYLDCLADFVRAGHQFQVGIIPMSADGKVHGRVDADTFRIWKGAPYPEEAFQVLAYLITTGGDKLATAYDAMPAITSKMDGYFQKKTEQFPFVTQESWEVFKAGVAYPDVPSADGYLPNFTEAYVRLQAFGDLMDNTPPEQFDFDAEFQKLEDDLTVIFNK